MVVANMLIATMHVVSHLVAAHVIVHLMGVVMVVVGLVLLLAGIYYDEVTFASFFEQHLRTVALMTIVVVAFNNLRYKTKESYKDQSEE